MGNMSEESDYMISRHKRDTLHTDYQQQSKIHVRKQEKKQENNLHIQKIVVSLQSHFREI